MIPVDVPPFHLTIFVEEPPVMADPPICSRLPSHLVDALEADASQQGLDRSEILRAIVEAYYFGTTPIAGADAGYHQGRRLAVQLAYRLLQHAQQALPDDFDAAMAWLQRPPR